MIEIFILIQLCKSLGNKLRQKGRSPTGMQFLLVGLWIACEFIGAIMGYVIGAIATGGDESSAFFGVAGAICGVIFAAVTVFQIAKAMQPAPEMLDRDRDDPYGPGWRERDRERLRRYDDEYDRPAPDDGITDRPERQSQRQPDDRIQE
jgi:hypothetical protein